MKSLFNCSLVSKQFNKVYNSDILWCKLLNNHNVDYINYVKEKYNVDNPRSICNIIDNLLIIVDSPSIKTFDDIIDLRSIYLTGSCFVECAKAFTSLINLKTLHVNYKELTDLPAEVKYYTSVENLYLEYNNFRSLPKEIGSLVNLTCLQLSCNQLTELPIEITSLVNLQDLYLASNQLTELPTEIKSLVNLECLNLEDNYLTSLPKEMAYLINLKELYLRGNQLTELSEELKLLPNLTTKLV